MNFSEMKDMIQTDFLYDIARNAHVEPEDLDEFNLKDMYNICERPKDIKRRYSNVYITEVETKSQYFIGFEKPTCLPAHTVLYLNARVYRKEADGSVKKITSRSNMPSKTMIALSIKKLLRKHKVTIENSLVNVKKRVGIIPVVIYNDGDDDKTFMPAVAIGKLKPTDDKEDTWDNHKSELQQFQCNFMAQMDNLLPKASSAKVDIPFNPDGKNFKVPDDKIALKLLEQEFINEGIEIDYEFMGVINTIELPESLKPDEAVKLLRVCYENRACFARSEYDIGLAKNFEFPIETGENPPIAEKPRRLSPQQREFVFDNIDELEVKGIIRRSDSPWAAPICVVPKKNGKFRMTLDFRRLNQVTVTNSYPLQRIDEITDALGGAKKFSLVDVLSGYHNVAIRAADICKTAFTCSGKGLYEWLRLPFGLKNAPSFFVQMMDITLADLLFNICLCYIDDIIIFSNTFNEHIDRLNIVFERLIKTGLKLRLDKCRFFEDEILFLGHVVSEKGIRPSEDKIEAVKSYPVPGCVTDLRSYLGLVGYYRRFIQDFAKIAHPLHQLLKKDVVFIWTEDCQKAYELLKEMLITAPLLAFPDFSPEAGQFQLHTDASLLGVGGVLEQIQSDGKTSRPVAYVNRGLIPSEKNMSITELECLAVHYAMRKFRPYLIGRPFTLVVDHSALSWLFKNGLSHLGGSRLVRWVIELQEYQFVVIHKPGKLHTHCDALSRAFPTIEKGKCFGECTEAELNAFYYDWVYAVETRAMKKKRLTAPHNESEDDESVIDEEMEPVHSAPNLGDALTYGENNSNEPVESNEPTNEPCKESSIEPESSKKHSKIIMETPNIGHDTEEDLETKQELINAQMLDPFSRDIINHITSKLLPDDEKVKDYILATEDQYFLDDGLLFHFYISPLGFRRPRAFKRLYIPFDFRERVLCAMHDGIMAGHYGASATYEKIARLYFWPTLAKDVNKYVKECEICQQVNSGRLHKRFKLRSIEIPSEPLELVSMDILYINDVGTKYYRNKYLLVIIDHKTRYLKAIPMRDEKAATVARLFIEHFVTNFGIPARLITDNGTNFLSITCEELYRSLGIHKSRTTVYYPSSDLVEISNRSILRMLRKFANNNHSEWDRYIHLLTYAYNSTVHSSTGESPFFLMFGRTPPIPSCYSNVDFEPVRSQAEYPANLAAKMKEIWATAGINNQLALDAIKEQHDKHAGELELLIPGDTVLVEGKILKSQAVLQGKYKLELPWSKFMKCISVNDDNNTVTVQADDGKVHTFNRQYVKKFHKRKQSAIPDSAVLSFLKKVEANFFLDIPNHWITMDQYPHHLHNVENNSRIVQLDVVSGEQQSKVGRRESDKQ